MTSVYRRAQRDANNFLNESRLSVIGTVEITNTIQMCEGVGTNSIKQFSSIRTACPRGPDRWWLWSFQMKMCKGRHGISES